MTEKTKYKWLTCLAYVLTFTLYYPIIIAIFLPIFVIYLPLAIIRWLANRYDDFFGDLLGDIQKWCEKPFRALLTKLGYYELLEKYHNKPES